MQRKQQELRIPHIATNENLVAVRKANANSKHHLHFCYLKVHERKSTNMTRTMHRSQTRTG